MSSTGPVRPRPTMDYRITDKPGLLPMEPEYTMDPGKIALIKQMNDQDAKRRERAAALAERNGTISQNVSPLDESRRYVNGPAATTDDMQTGLLNILMSAVDPIAGAAPTFGSASRGMGIPAAPRGYNSLISPNSTPDHMLRPAPGGRRRPSVDPGAVSRALAPSVSDADAAATIAKRNIPEPGFVQDPSPEEVAARWDEGKVSVPENQALIDAIQTQYANDPALPDISIDDAPAPKPAWAEDLPDEAPQPRENFDPSKATVEIRDDPYTNNASAESGSGGSAEALSRIEGMRAKGQRFVRRGPGGQIEPSNEDGGIGLPRGWEFGIEGPGGFSKL